MRRLKVLLVALLVAVAPVVAVDGAAPVKPPKVVGGDPSLYHDAGETRPE